MPEKKKKGKTTCKHYYALFHGFHRETFQLENIIAHGLKCE